MVNYQELLLIIRHAYAPATNNFPINQFVSIPLSYPMLLSKRID
jgi:hypothetical protein